MDKNELVKTLTKEVFWNCSVQAFDYKRDRDYIIKRIIEYGLEHDEIIMWQLYSYIEIKHVFVNMDYLPEEKMVYMCFVLNIEKEECKCCQQKPWHRK